MSAEGVFAPSNSAHPDGSFRRGPRCCSTPRSPSFTRCAGVKRLGWVQVAGSWCNAGKLRTPAYFNAGAGPNTGRFTTRGIVVKRLGWVQVAGSWCNAGKLRTPAYFNAGAGPNTGPSLDRRRRLTASTSVTDWDTVLACRYMKAAGHAGSHPAGTLLASLDRRRRLTASTSVTDWDTVLACRYMKAAGHAASVKPPQKYSATLMTA